MNGLDFGAIFKRTSSLNSTESKVDSENIFKKLDNIKLESVREGYVPISYNNILNECINSLSDKENASKYWYKGLDIIQRLNNHNADRDARLFTDKYISRVLPYIENIVEVMDALDRYDLTDYQVESITNICEQYKLADKIVNNHNQLSKRFNNIEYEVKAIKSKGLDYVVEKCCFMLDTYSYEPYQKLNMCIEEMVYLFEKNNINYRPDELIFSILEYFLLRSSNITDRDIKGYKYVMEHNRCVDDMSSSKFLFEDFDIVNIKSAINGYLKIKNKTLENTQKQFIDILNSTSIEDLKNNNDCLLNFLYKLYTSQTCQDLGVENTLEVIGNILTVLVDRYTKESMTTDNISRDHVLDLISSLNKFKSNIIVNDINDDMISDKIKFKSMIDNIISVLNDLSNSIYSTDNLKSLDYINSDNCEEMALREFKIFKFNNIVKATINLDKYLKTRIKNFINKTKSRRKVKLGHKKIKNILFDENGRLNQNSIYNFIGSDNKVDICALQIELESENDVSEALDELSAICKEFNNELNVNRLDGIRAYYMINGCIAEIHIKDSTKIILTEEEQSLINESYNPALDVYIDQLALFEACNIISEDFEDKSLDEKIASIFNEDINLSLEAYDVAMDCLSLIGATKDQVDMFTESFSDYRNRILTESSEIISENKFIKSIYNNWESVENVPYDIQVEAYKIFNDIINEAGPKVAKPKVGGEAVKKPQDKKEDKDGDKEEGKDKEYNPSSSMSNKLNNLKIYLKGLKSKAKDFSQKEKELSRQLDASFNNFSKSVKNALISDRREAIIKGSVIPSFSKSIKICLGLAVLGIVSGNPIVPLIAAMGGFAVSKNLTKKERILLLDEIETEIEVVEKEIANADAKNQIKKYRALLKYKKDLQRQYQRIKYNVRVGKDILPGSAEGFKERN